MGLDSIAAGLPTAVSRGRLSSEPGTRLDQPQGVSGEAWSLSGMAAAGVTANIEVDGLPPISGEQVPTVATSSNGAASDFGTSDSAAVGLAATAAGDEQFPGLIAEAVETVSNGDGSEPAPVADSNGTSNGGASERQWSSRSPRFLAETGNAVVQGGAPAGGTVDPAAAETAADTSAIDAENTSTRSDITSATVDLRSAYQSTVIRMQSGGALRVTEQVAAAIVSQAVLTDVGDTLTLDTILDPPDLGRVHLRLTRTASGFTAQIAADNGDVQHVIADHMASIEQSVRTQLRTEGGLEFTLSDRPFGDGSSAPGHSFEDRPPLRTEAHRGHADRADRSFHPLRRSLAEVDVLA